MEVDILTKLDPNGHLSFCTEFISDGKWFELLGSGLIAKNILERYGYLNTNGFAIGLGIERLAMLKYGINDLRDFYANKYPFIQNASFNIQDFGEN
jgi:phenylalanyl-tRNA synthetase alpha subunit